MDPFESLSADNRDQLKKYLKFFAQKKDGLLRTINIEFADAKADKLYGDMYSREDVEDFCEFLASAVKNNVSAEVGVLVNMGALAVSQLLENAQDMGVHLTLETAAVENQSLLQAIEKMGLESLPPSAKRSVNALSSFKDDVKASKEESNRLEKKNAQLQDEVEALTRKLSQMDRQLSNVRSDSAASEGKRSEESHASDRDKLRIRKLEDELSDCQEEGKKRVMDTAQFKQMRQLMQTQSSNLRDLRRRLEKYEPDTVGDGDDDNDT